MGIAAVAFEGEAVLVSEAAASGLVLKVAIAAVSADHEATATSKMQLQVPEGASSEAQAGTVYRPSTRPLMEPSSAEAEAVAWASAA